MSPSLPRLRLLAPLALTLLASAACPSPAPHTPAATDQATGQPSSPAPSPGPSASAAPQRPSGVTAPPAARRPRPSATPGAGQPGTTPNAPATGSASQTPPTRPLAPVLGSPWRRPLDPGRRDELIFWGWSADGRHYAFQTRFDGPGAHECEGQADLYVVDAHTDRFVDGGHVSFTGRPADEGRRCIPPNVGAALDAARPALLARYGIEPGHVVEPVAFRQEGGGWRLPLPDGRLWPLRFRSIGGDWETVYNSGGREGAAYELILDVPGETARTIEPGRRQRAGVLEYGLDDAWVFWNPQGDSAALLIRKRILIWEGARTSWMSNGVTGF